MTKEQPTIYVGIDVSKDKLAVALAGGGLRDDVVSLGTFEMVAFYSTSGPGARPRCFSSAPCKTCLFG